MIAPLGYNQAMLVQSCHCESQRRCRIMKELLVAVLVLGAVAALDRDVRSGDAEVDMTAVR